MVRYLGELSFILGMAALVPTLGALLFQEPLVLVAYALNAALLVGLGWLARRTPAPRDLQRSEALVVTAAAFVASPLVMSAPLVVQGIPWIDALFEAVSGVTTTGLSTLTAIEGRPRTFLLARAWMQWIGGLGFVVLSLALVLEQGVATRRLGAPGLDPADLAGSMRSHARSVLMVYLALTGAGVAVLLALGATAFDAVLHAFAGVSTGGFAPRDSSLAGLPERLQPAVLGVSLLGAVSLSLYGELRRGRWRRLLDDAQTRGLLVLIVAVAALLLVMTGVGGESGRPPVRDLALLAVSAQTTTGFSTFDVGELPGSALVVLIASMITGGCLGSTAGGIKVLRVLVLVRLVQWLVAETRLPIHAVSGPALGGHRLESNELLRAAALIVLFMGVLFASWLPFLAYGYPPLKALFEIASATGTVGLTAGIARPDLEPPLKLLLCADMLLGRLEVFALLVTLSPRTWIGRRTT